MRVNLQSKLLGNDITALGDNPPIFLDSDQAEFPVVARWKLRPEASIFAGVAPLVGSGSLTAGQSPGGTLVIPVQPGGASLETGLRILRGSSSLVLAASTSHASDSAGLVAPGSHSGTSHYTQQSQTVGARWTRFYRRLGSVELHYENVSAHEGFTAFDPDGSALSTSLPGGSSVYGTGDFTFRRTEFGVGWTTRSEKWHVTYRQIWAPFSLGGSYDADYLFLNLGQSGGLQYTTVNLGALAASYRVKIAGAAVTLGIQQIVPYALLQASQPSVSPANHPTTLGGTTAWVVVTFFSRR